jgi:hypothetical protein
MDLSVRYQPNDDVTFQRLEDTTVIVHLGTGRIHHTNVTGSRIWELLAEGRSLEEMLPPLADEFEAPPERLRSDLESFIRTLLEANMIRRKEPA